MLHGRYSPLRPVTGFTLIELLLALAMFAIIVGVIFASFAALVDGVDKGRESADIYRVGRGALQQITQELRAALWFEDDPRTRLIGENDEVDKQPRDRISFVTIPYRRFSAEVPENELCKVSYFLDQNARDELALFRTQDCTPDDPAADEDDNTDDTRLELTDRAIGLDITYYDAEGEHESWPPDGSQEGLPCRVRVAVKLLDFEQVERSFITSVPLLMRVMRGTCVNQEGQG
jgi:type II secretion system protein J